MKRLALVALIALMSGCAPKYQVPSTAQQDERERYWATQEQRKAVEAQKLLSDSPPNDGRDQSLNCILSKEAPDYEERLVNCQMRGR